MNMLNYRNSLDLEKYFEPVSYINYFDIESRDYSRLWFHFNKIFSLNKKVLLHPDGDPDGILAVRNLTYLFERVCFDNYTVELLKEKIHGIQDFQINKYLGLDYDYIIICDSSSEVEIVDKLKPLADQGKIIIILDHHEVSYEEINENIIVINPKFIENKNYYFLSATALIAEFVDKYTQDSLGNKKDFQDNPELLINAVVSLYSDSCLMNNHNRALWTLARKVDKENFPSWLKIFIKPYSELTRNFVSFSVIPKINGAVRTNNFLILEDIIYRNNISEDTLIILNGIKEQSDGILNSLMDSLIISEYENLVYAEIDSSAYNSSIVENFRGLISSKLANIYNKIAFTVTRENNLVIGSARDPINTTAYEKIQNLVNGKGHKSAFGIRMDLFDVDRILAQVNTLLEGYTSDSNLIISLESFEDFLIPNLIRDIAYCNEFLECPILLSKRFRITDFRQKERHAVCKYKNCYINYMGNVSEVDFNKDLIMQVNYSSNSPSIFIRT